MTASVVGKWVLISLLYEFSRRRAGNDGLVLSSTCPSLPGQVPVKSPPHIIVLGIGPSGVQPIAGLSACPGLPAGPWRQQTHHPPDQREGAKGKGQVTATVEPGLPVATVFLVMSGVDTVTFTHSSTQDPVSVQDHEASSHPNVSARVGVGLAQQELADGSSATRSSRSQGGGALGSHRGPHIRLSLTSLHT